MLDIRSVLPLSNTLGSAFLLNFSTRCLESSCHVVSIGLISVWTMSLQVMYGPPCFRQDSSGLLVSHDQTDVAYS